MNYSTYVKFGTNIEKFRNPILLFLEQLDHGFICFKHEILLENCLTSWNYI